MTILRIDHVNLRTHKLDDMIAWYVDVLGLVNGPRPDFSFPGAWLYAGDHALVHLVGIETDDAVGSEADLKMEHVAFTAEDEATFHNRLDARGERYQRAKIADTGLVAFNVWDPDGNHLHIDFAEQG